MRGIVSFGAYAPRHRLRRAAIADANEWFARFPPALKKGCRTTANWDEDAVTMAVAAALRCVHHRRPDEVWLASTTAPFADRLNAGIVSGALGLEERSTGAQDFGGSQRAGTSSLATAFGQKGRTVLVSASDRRRTKAASLSELTSGDGAAAVLVGEGDVLAEMIGWSQSTCDFVDHYRAASAEFDYSWEERWVRDEGVLALVPETAAEAMKSAGVSGADIDHLILPTPVAGVAEKIAKQLGVAETALAPSLQGEIGYCGAAHPLLMLCETLERAGAGQTILLIGFGQGCDAAILRTTESLPDFEPSDPLRAQIAHGLVSDNYMRFLSLNGLIEIERGIRAELDLPVQPSISYRNRAMLLGFVGGKCSECGAVQFPKKEICVNPDCGATGALADYNLARSRGVIQSFTADTLTYTPDPPARYGMINFAEGGCLMMDIADAAPDEIAVGAEVEMAFRIKRRDPRRGATAYFWKAIPSRTTARS